MNERELFEAALEITDPGQRSAFLHAACSTDTPLREHIEGLLKAHEMLGSFLASPPTGLDATVDRPRAQEGPDTVLGPYRLLRQLGEGGMGTVWLAEQKQPVQRQVALKIIKPGLDSRQVLARFEAERQALALMDHPNIAKVHDAGTTPDGRPFFVMELVKGRPITQYCDEHRLTLKARLELFIPACQAIQHAHQKGIIHRDVKPSNILVTSYDGRPVVKVIDFGIAKATGQRLTEKTLFTEFGAIVGTLEYMSPEQAELNSHDIDTRSDVYSLGVLLYELLTGTTPLDRARLKQMPFAELLRMIREEDPPRPSTRLSSTEPLPAVAANRGLEAKRLSGLVKGELDWIVMRALEKDRSRRYESANAFARDVERYLNDEPVQACPPSATYAVRKFVRRNKQALATGVVILAAVLFAAGILGWALRDRKAREQEMAQEAARQSALTEQGVREALEHGARLRNVLHRELETRGTRDLLNQPARWQAQIDTARSELERARALAARAEGKVDPELIGMIEQMDRALTGDEADYRLARRLDRVRLDMTTVVKGDFNYAHAEREYPLAFAGAELEVAPGREQELAGRIARSAIKDQLLAALDHWAFVAERQHRELAGPLLTIARLADPDPWRDRARDPARLRDRKAIVVLAEEARKDGKFMAGLSPQMLQLVGYLLPKEDREAWLRRAQALHPADFCLNYDLATVLADIEDRSREAISFARAAVALRPDSTAAYNVLGNALLAHKDLAAAMAAYQKALDLDSQFAPTWNNLGVALQDQEDLLAARRAFEKAVAIDPNLGPGWHNLGTLLSGQGDMPGAVAAFKKALEIDPKDTHAWGQLGYALYAQKDLPAARDACKKALEIDPRAGAAWSILGMVLAAQGEVPAALEAHQKAVTFAPRLATGWYNLGNALFAQKDLPAAADAFKKAVAIDPRYASAWTNLGLVRYAQQDLPAAVEAFRKALEINPRVGEAHGSLGMALLKQGQFAEAREALQQSLKLLPPRDRRRPQAQEDLLQCEQLLALEQKLIAYLEKGETPADPGTLLGMATVAWQYKQYHAAGARLCAAAFEADPKVGDATIGIRWAAASAAAQAGCGGGKDPVKPDEKERVRLRGLALDWLRAELAAWQRLAEKGPRVWPGVLRTMDAWQKDPDFAGVRGDAIAQLPEAERQEWERLWKDIEALHQRAVKATTKPSPGKE